MRFLVYSDIHFYHAWPEFNPLQPSGLTKRFQIQLDIWHAINQLAKDRQATAKLFAGDLLDKRTFVHTTVINPLINLYKKALTIPELLISGNHDRFSPDYNTVQFLDGIGKASVLAPNSNPVQYFASDKFRVSVQAADPGGVPPPPVVYTPDPSFPLFRILLAHGALYGAEAQSGFEMKGGYTLEQFEGYDLVILGDIHKKQIIGNVLIPGAPLQMNWGDSQLECGCWEIEIDISPTRKLQHQAIFHPLKAPKFICVMQDNLETVLAQESDDFNYYDFRISETLEPEQIAELRARFPNSYIVPPVAERPNETVTITKYESDADILQKFFAHKIKVGSEQAFLAAGLDYLAKASGARTVGGHKHLEFLWMKAENFMCFEAIEVDFRTMEQGVHLITGVSDEASTLTNSIGKSTLATEILSYVLYDKLVRSSTRAKDRLIFDPNRKGKPKNLLGEVGIRVDGATYIIQRYRKHDELGTGCRILVQE